jgi:ribosomal protein S18 acetylase RimI-like enzyme
MSLEIPVCENCGKIAQYKCAIDEKYVCCECARFVPISKKHLRKQPRPKIVIKVLEKMKQDTKERTMFEAIEDMTGCPPPKEINFEEEWKPRPGYVYGHEKYKVMTMIVYVDGEHAGYLDYLFTMDPDEVMSIQFWEMAIHPKFQNAGIFSAMIEKLKEIACKNNVKRLYVSHENDNLPAIVAEYMLGGKILYVRELSEAKGRFGVPRRNDLVFVFELKK